MSTQGSGAPISQSTGSGQSAPSTQSQGTTNNTGQSSTPTTSGIRHPTVAQSIGSSQAHTSSSTNSPDSTQTAATSQSATPVTNSSPSQNSNQIPRPAAIPAASTVQSPHPGQSSNTGQNAITTPVNAAVQNPVTVQNTSAAQGGNSTQNANSLPNSAMNTAQPTQIISDPAPRKSLPWCLGLWGLLCQILAQIAIIVIICALMRVSRDRNGIAGVPDTPSSFKDTSGIHQVVQWSRSLLWTTLPTWVMSAYAAFWSAMLAQLQTCQPMVELMKYENGSGNSNKFWMRVLFCFPSARRTPSQSNHGEMSTVKKTLLLDYSQYVPGQNIYVAARNGHYLVSTCMLIKCILFLAVGFSAAIFAVVQGSSESNIQVTTRKFFDAYYQYAEMPDMQSTFDVVSATLINGVLPYPWTTSNQSFLPFESPFGSSTRNITASTQSYWTASNCTSIDTQGYTLILESSGNNDTDPTTANFKFNDRNCSIAKYMTISSARRRYVQTWTEVNCPDDSSAGGPSWRMGIIAGDWDPSSPKLLSNLSIISCIPTIWTSSELVTVGIDHQIYGNVIGSSKVSQTQIWPYFAPTFLETIPQYIIFEPIGNPNTTLQLDGLARLIYKYAGIQNTTNAFSSPVLKKINIHRLRRVLCSLHSA